jgi:predicted nucleic-acid-binding Zn-ribbon protein
MKNSLVCPKCGGRKLWHVLKVKPAMAIEYFPMAVRDGARVGRYETFTCAACGYTEWYALDLPDEQFERRIREQQARDRNSDSELVLIEGATPVGPYR